MNAISKMVWSHETIVATIFYKSWVLHEGGVATPKKKAQIC